tara:strand:+ start:3549 stop:3728 length:180 start_codon:yes stop_codon:yes gene_type:complete
MSNSARASHFASNISKGTYVKQFKFAKYGSVVEDSIKAQQRQADRRLAEIQAKRARRLA